MNNRIEYLSGHRWAREICLNSTAILSLPMGHERLIATLRLGLVQKPADYASGVQSIIQLVENSELISSLRSEQ